MIKQKLITIVGPTASGKSDLALFLARAFHTTIISGDAYQVYRGMDIGTAKVSLKDRRDVHHFLVDVLNPDESYTASLFQEEARHIIEEENKNGRIPILAGGTGLYVQGLLENYSFLPKGEHREAFENLYKKEGKEGLVKAILHLNPKAEVPLDPHRMIRMLEVLTGGNTMKADHSMKLIYDGPVLGISMDRKLLYDKINKRVNVMIQKGLYQEVQRLLSEGVSEDAQALKAIGYKEMIPAVQGVYSIDRAEELIQRNTRHFAKRQMTWYRRRMPYIHWINKPQDHLNEWYRNIAQYITSYYRGEKNGR